MSVSLISSRTVRDNVSKDKNLRRAAEVVLFPAHTGTNVQVCTPMQVHGDGAAFICPAKRTDPKCAKFTQLKEMALSIHSRHCKAEGTH